MKSQPASVVIAAIAFLLLGSIVTAVAQQNHFVITGRVVTAENPSIGVANVVVRNVQSDLLVRTDADGYYRFWQIPIGKYSIEILAATSENADESIITRSALIRGYDVRIPDVKVSNAQSVVFGRVTRSGSRFEGLANVKIIADNGCVAITDANGYYTLRNLRTNTTYTITPALGEVEYAAVQRTLTLKSSLIRQDFAIETVTERRLKNVDDVKTGEKALSALK
jgi:hypothetical protein